MTQEELKDLCAKLPYGAKVQYNNKIYDISYVSPLYGEVKLDTLDNYTVGVSEIKPYIKPLSSMTEEEKIELYTKAGFYYHSNFELERDEWRAFSDAISENKLFLPYPIWGDDLAKVYDWLNEHNYDYRGIIK